MFITLFKKHYPLSQYYLVKIWVEKNGFKESWDYINQYNYPKNLIGQFKTKSQKQIAQLKNKMISLLSDKNKCILNGNSENLFIKTLSKIGIMYPGKPQIKEIEVLKFREREREEY